MEWLEYGVCEWNCLLGRTSISHVTVTSIIIIMCLIWYQWVLEECMRKDNEMPLLLFQHAWKNRRFHTVILKFAISPFLCITDKITFYLGRILQEKITDFKFPLICLCQYELLWVIKFKHDKKKMLEYILCPLWYPLS